MSNAKGKEITTVFRYVQQVFRESQQILAKIDSLMAPDWKTAYGNRVTKEVSSHFKRPEEWLVEAVFRVYQGNSKLINKGINISYWGEDLEEPLITACKITYSDIKGRDHWDILNAWFYWPQDDLEIKPDGRVFIYKPEEDDYIEEIKVFSLPLVTIENDQDIETKIFKPLMAL